LPNHQDNAEHTFFLFVEWGIIIETFTCHYCWEGGQPNPLIDASVNCDDQIIALWIQVTQKKTHPMQFYYTNNLHTAWNIPLFLSKHPKNESALPHVNAMLGISTSESGNR